MVFLTALFTSKDLIKQLFSFKNLPQTPFIPWICSHAAKLEQISVQAMLTNPTLLARAFQNTQKLYGYDVIINVFDPVLEAEACGCPIRWGKEYELPSIYPMHEYEKIVQLEIEKRGRIPIVLEAMRRLKIVLGRMVAVAGVVTGPLNLASLLTGNNIIHVLEEKPEEAKKVMNVAGQVVMKICKAYCELEPDLIVVTENLLPQIPSEHFQFILSIFKPILNLISFYNAKSVLLLKECTPEKLEEIFKSGFRMDAVVVNTNFDVTELKKVCLLYTSPSPRDLSTSRMPSSA